MDMRELMSFPWEDASMHFMVVGESLFFAAANACGFISVQFYKKSVSF